MITAEEARRLTNIALTSTTYLTENDEQSFVEIQKSVKEACENGSGNIRYTGAISLIVQNQLRQIGFEVSLMRLPFCQPPVVVYFISW